MGVSSALLTQQFLSKHAVKTLCSCLVCWFESKINLDMASENKPPLTLPAASTAQDDTSASDEEKITLFAPFEALKSSRSLFQRSEERDSEYNSSRSEARSREIEFQESATGQSSGSAVVLFRKLKAVVSGSSSSSTSSTSSPAQLNSRPPTLVANTSNHPPSDNRCLQSGQRAKYSPTPSARSASSGVEHGGVSAEPSVTASVEQNLSEEPRISLTSYSDPHSHMTKKSAHPGGGAVGGGGVVRPQAQAVNKTEMLKRFGSIADNKVQVCLGGHSHVKSSLNF